MFRTSSKYLLAASLFAALAGCASYRTDTDTTFASTKGLSGGNKIVISETAPTDKKYKELGPVEGEVKKLTIFHRDPTKEQVDIILTEKAAALGADGVINVVYKSGVGMTTWGYIEAKGTAVKFTD